MGRLYYDRLREVGRKSNQPLPNSQGFIRWEGSLTEWRVYGNIVTAHCQNGINKGKEYVFFDGDDYIISPGSVWSGNSRRKLRWYEKIIVFLFYKRRAKKVQRENG